MANLACTIDNSGITSPTYEEILTNLKESYYSIFGTDAYLGNDSQDGQLLAIFAAALNDSNSATIKTYNSFSPSFAQGVGLSSVVKINGISRLVPTNSTATINCIGVAGTIITNGVLSDTNGNRWLLPATITIPQSGSVIVTATAEEKGSISAPAGSINVIATPTRGWQTSVSTTDAIHGNPVETDAQLRQRQTISTAYPAVAVNSSIKAVVANTIGVIKSKVYENPTGTTDSNGIPAHSISVVVYGGDPYAVANAIATKKTPGTGTYGSSSQNVSINGTNLTIHFFQATATSTTATITIIPKTGYTHTDGLLAKQNLVDYVASLDIGQVFEFSQALAVCVGPTYKLETIKLTIGASNYTNIDVSQAFNALLNLPLTSVTLVE